ncbi:related to glyoxal oxidase precursor [Rhynchosporium graminicola]|uniref:Related to glyoxal oxidase n=1 Tax=Rhynchosporium graminicola TaxID=2792576 RepID=A0A1E1JWU6_9HELO|nr:related to glyoxal oxidase precursor [Rhynchosporium commune]
MRVLKIATTLKVALLGSLAVQSVSGFWRMPCRVRTAAARIDPLVNNGSISQHVHAIHGSGGFSATAGYDDLRASDCTSCQVTQDKSAYWHPALYFKSEDGKYYLLVPNANNPKITAFPKGFEMIAGDSNQRNFSYPVPDIEKSLWFGKYAEQPFLRQAAVGFNCLNYKRTPEGTLTRHFLPDKAYLDANCDDGIRFELHFPSCWNGRDRTSHDKKSHVAYPGQVMTGECKEEFPVRLPSLMYEIIWATNAFKGIPGSFILSSGDTTGYGMHGDFMMGWDEGFLQQAIDTCTNPSGKIEDCPLFTIQEEHPTCALTLPPAIAKENVQKNLDTLPGNPVIANGPAYAGGAAAGGAMPPANTGPVVAVPTLSYTPGHSLASTEKFVPGGIFAQKVTSTPESEPTPTPYAMNIAAAPPPPPPVNPTTLITSPTRTPTINPTPTPTPKPTVPATTKDGAIFSTEYKTHTGANGVVIVDVILWELDFVTVTDSAAPPATTYQARSEKPKRHIHAHRRGVYA